MMFPSAIIMVNADLTQNTQDMLVRQLAITSVLDGYTFDSNVLSNSNYISQLKAANMRVMVVESLACPNNKNIVDLVLFIKAGLITVIQNNITGRHLGYEQPYGPFPGETPTDPNSVRTHHRLYPDQLHGLQYRNFELHRHDFINDHHYDRDCEHHRGPPAVTIQIVNITWGALGIY